MRLFRARYFFLICLNNVHLWEQAAKAAGSFAQDHRIPPLILRIWGRARIMEVGFFGYPGGMGYISGWIVWVGRIVLVRWIIPSGMDIYCIEYPAGLNYPSRLAILVGRLRLGYPPIMAIRPGRSFLRNICPPLQGGQSPGGFSYELDNRLYWAALMFIPNVVR